MTQQGQVRDDRELVASTVATLASQSPAAHV